MKFAILILITASISFSQCLIKFNYIRKARLSEDIIIVLEDKGFTVANTIKEKRQADFVVSWMTTSYAEYGLNMSYISGAIRHSSGFRRKFFTEMDIAKAYTEIHPDNKEFKTKAMKAGTINERVKYLSQVDPSLNKEVEVNSSPGLEVANKLKTCDEYYGE